MATAAGALAWHTSVCTATGSMPTLRSSSGPVEVQAAGKQLPEALHHSRQLAALPPTCCRRLLHLWRSGAW
jgi:hypothetical protein